MFFCCGMPWNGDQQPCFVIQPVIVSRWQHWSITGPKDIHIIIYDNSHTKQAMQVNLSMRHGLGCHYNTTTSSHKQVHWIYLHVQLIIQLKIRANLNTENYVSICLSCCQNKKFLWTYLGFLVIICTIEIASKWCKSQLHFSMICNFHLPLSLLILPSLV